MYKPNNSRPDREKRRGIRLATMTGATLAAVTGMLLQLPLGANAGIASVDDGRIVSLAPALAPAANQKPSSSYQLHCWQHGRLLFDEGPVTLGAEAR